MPCEDRADKAAYAPFVVAQKDRLRFGDYPHHDRLLPRGQLREWAHLHFASRTSKARTVYGFRTIRTSWHSLLRSQLNDVTNFISSCARRVVPSQNYPDYAIFDFDHITYF